MLLHDSRQGSSPAGSQMTIFYGGQAHVFDNVHPNKVCLLLYQITLLFCVSTVSVRLCVVFSFSFFLSRLVNNLVCKPTNKLLSNCSLV